MSSITLPIIYYFAMYSQLLQEIGFTPNEAKVYETLLSTGVQSASAIALGADVPRRNVYDTLNRLVKKGFVFRILQSRDHLFQAVNPDKLMEVLVEKQNKLKQALPELKNIYQAEAPKEAAYIYKGVEGFKNYMRDLVRIGEETFFLSAKGLWFSPQVDESFLNEFVAMSEKKNITYHTLYDPRVKTELPEAVQKVKGKYKFLPEGYATPGVVDVFGDHVVTFTSVDVGNFGEDGMIFVIINKKIAESYRTWFKMIWDLLPSEK